MNRKRRPRARKSRTKSKKQKFLSLRRQFSSDDTKKTELLTEMCSRPSSSKSAAAPTADNHGCQHLKLFPVHSENQLDHERDNHDHENVAYFFSAADGGATSLTGLLDASTAAASHSSHATANDGSGGDFRPDPLSPPSGSLTYVYRGQDRNSPAALVRNALKNRERDSSEEKWVCYSEVVETKVKEEEVTSSAFDLRPAADDRGGIQRLSLKLDYQEILNAWSDKGPLYIHAERSQIVPDVNDDNFLSHDTSNHGMGWGCNVGLWTVPEMPMGNVKGGLMMYPTPNDRDQNHELIKFMGQREASVLRYKEKRQNRLFSKKIRYQVRKLNAEKRPRLKGRFVKRC